MKRRYVIACSSGLAVGLLSILFAAGLNPFGDKWEIPRWDTWQQYARPEMLPLQIQAVLLRSLRLLLENGFLYFLVPTVIACGLAKLDELGKNNHYLWCVSKSAFITIGGVFLVSFTWGMLAGPSDSEVPPYLGYQLLEGFGDSIFLVFMAWASLIAPTFWLVLFLVMLKRFAPAKPKRSGPF